MASLLEYPQAMPFSLKVCFGLKMSYMRYIVYRLHFQNALVLVILTFSTISPTVARALARLKMFERGKHLCLQILR